MCIKFVEGGLSGCQFISTRLDVYNLNIRYVDHDSGHSSLLRKPIFEWYMATLVYKGKLQKGTCYNEIGHTIQVQ